MKRNIQLYSLIISLLFFTSCAKLVDIDDPIDTVTHEKIFLSDHQADQTIAGLYGQLLFGAIPTQITSGYTTIYAGLASDEFEVTNTVDFPQDYEINKNDILPDNNVIKENLWDSAYKIIFTANSILSGEEQSKSEKLSRKKREELKGTAKFFRAYCFFYLTGFFGNIPLPLSDKYVDNLNIGKATSEQAYAQMIIDLKESIEHFKAAALPIKKVKINELSAEALLARVYLYNKDYELAKLHANNVINSNQFQLSSIENVFKKNSTETIFQVELFPPHDITTLPEIQNLAPYVQASVLGPNDWEIIYDPSFYSEFAPYLIPHCKLSESFLASFDSSDLRYSNWVDFNGSPSVAPYYGKKTYFIKKYQLSLTNEPYSHYIFLRLAEMYLIRAEAETMLNNPTVGIEDVNRLRIRAGLTNSSATSKEDVLEAIANERKFEFVGEWGHRFFDLKRTGKAISQLSTIPHKAGINLNKLNFPIPVFDLTRNPMLTQNPGY